MTRRALLHAAALIGLASLTHSLRAQTAASPQPQPRSPQLLAGVEGAKERKPLRLASADVRVVLAGPLAETTMTLTFRNDTPRQLEGELAFPLPEGATVSGFGLDVNGALVDGVPVPKEKGRVTYESESRHRVDPGLVEQTVGNNFRTRVYPIPPNGTRTVKVQYVADVVGAEYRLPLGWGQAVDAATITIEANEPGAALRARLKDDDIPFQAMGATTVACTALKDATLDADLTVTLPGAATRQVLVERRLPPLTVNDLLDHKVDARTGEHYFLIANTPTVRLEPAATKPPLHVGVLWDASLSRLKADKSRELKLLRAVLSRMDPNGGGAVEVIPFRNEPDAPKYFHAGDLDGVTKYLETLTYDGGTNLGALRIVRNAQQLSNFDASKTPPDFDFWLLFTDGIADLGPDLPRDLDAPVYAVSNDATANSALLRRIATRSGGGYVNLQRLTDEQAASAIAQEQLTLLGVDAKSSEVADLFPRGAQPVNGRVTVTGKLLIPQATVSLKYGVNGVVMQRVDVPLKQAGATVTGLVPRFWAQQQIAELSADPDANQDALEAVGKSFNLVTPNTSLIVLESVEQYLQHGIVPPPTNKPLYEQFTQRIEQQRTQQAKTKEERLAQVAALWQQRVQWWEERHEYAANFKYREAPAEAPRAGLAVSDAIGLDGAAQSPAPARPAVPSPEPVAGPNSLASAPAPAGAVRREAELAPHVAEQRLADRQDVELQQARGRGFAAGGRGTDLYAAAKAKREGGEGLLGPSIAIKPWDPDVPYLKAMREAGPDAAYAAYLKNRDAYLASPAFYLDCADYLLRNNQQSLGLRVLTNVAELKLDDAQLLRIVAHRMNQAGQRELAIDLFEKIKRMRPEEPQSWRDLALALSDRADATIASDPQSDAGRRNVAPLIAAMNDYDRALDLLEHVIATPWDRFPEIEVTALMEANRILSRLQAVPIKKELRDHLFDPRFRKNLDCDVRIVLTWDADLTDVDLWVTEPSGEKCFYQHNRTTIGGLLSRDLTQGYGPEEYCLRKMMPSQYKVQANYYGSSQTSLVGPATVQATVITNFGRPDEKRQALTVRVDKPKDVVDLGTITLGAEVR